MEVNIWRYFVLLKKYEEMYIKIRNLIRTITDNSKFNLDDNLPLKKTLELRNMVIVFRSVFHEDHKYYPKVFIDECLYNYKRYILIELTFLKVVILIRQAY